MLEQAVCRLYGRNGEGTVEYLGSECSEVVEGAKWIPNWGGVDVLCCLFVVAFSRLGPGVVCGVV